MVIRISFRDLECDDEGAPKNMQIGVHYLPVRYATIQTLLGEWLSDGHNAYREFIEKHALEGIVTAEQLATLFTDNNTRMGKHLAGILSLLVPPELCSWLQMKNIYERVGGNQDKIEVEISKEAACSWLDRFSNLPGMEFRHLLRLHRRFRMYTQKDLAQRSDVSQVIIGDYERGDTFPNDPAIVHKICDALKVDPQIRLQMLDLASNHALSKLEDKEHWHEAIAAFLGGGSPFGARLYRLREEKGWSQKDLEKRSGVSAYRMSHYERGSTFPDSATVKKLCDALKVDKKTRLQMLDLAENGALAKRINKNDWRDHAVSGEDSSFGDLLRYLRLKKGWSQKDLEQRSGVPKGSIAHYERYGVLPELDTADKLCDALEADKETRLQMLDLAGDHALAKLDNKKHWRKGLIGFIGGGSLFGALLFHLRKEKGWLQKDLAQRSGVSESNICNYEIGRILPDAPATVHRLCDALQLDEKMRLRMLDLAGDHVLAKLEDKEHWREGLAAFIGGANLFGALLYRLREDKGWSQKDLAKRSGVAERSIGNYEQDGNLPDPNTVDKLCDALQLDEKMRLRMLNLAGDHALAKLEDKEPRRKGLTAFLGGGSLFGAMLYRLREDKGWLQKDLAQRSGVPRGSISSYERGDMFPHNFATVHKLCDALEVGAQTRKMMLEMVASHKISTKGKGL